MNTERLTSFLVPQLPQLLNPDTSNTVDVESAMTNRARRMWQLLAPEVRQREVAQTAVEKLAATPTARDWLQTLQLQLQEIFGARPDIAAQVEMIWREGTAPETTDESAASQISVNGNENVAVGSVSGHGRVYGKVGGSIDESQGKAVADRGGQIAGQDATRGGGNFFSNNTVTVMLVFIVILALGGVTWALATRLGSDGIEIETQGGEQPEQLEEPGQLEEPEQ